MPRLFSSALFAFVVVPGLAIAQTANLDHFESKIRPLLIENCLGCHSAESGKMKGKLALDSRLGWETGGESGPAIVPGSPEKSLLLRAVGYQDDALRMPPKGRLDDDQIAALTTWIRNGAEDPRAPATDAPKSTKSSAPSVTEAQTLWNFRPPANPSPPTVIDATWPKSGIDRFILSALESKGLKPAPRADLRTLVRRASLVLTGLPPTFETLERVTSDPAPNAFEQEVDRLLASPHFGEHWGRHWLDLVRYADSNGLDENIALAEAWRYRDYVVRSINADKPYDRFLEEQVAGDLLTAKSPTDHDPKIATGFWVLGPKMLAEQDKEKLVLDIVDEQIDVFSRTFLGLTISCARCHDHKFDPISHADYYALAGILKSTSSMQHLDHVSRWRELPLATDEEIKRSDAWKKEDAETRATLKAEVEAASEEARESFRSDLASYLVAAAEISPRALLLEAESAPRKNLVVDSNHWGTKDVTVVRTGHPDKKPQFLEFDVTLPKSGRWSAILRYAAEESRPLRMSLNGETLAAEVASTITGAWMPRGQRFSQSAVLDLKAGLNTIRFERDGAFPHVDQLALVPGDQANSRSDLVPEVLAGFLRAFARAETEFDPILEPFVRAIRFPSTRFAECWAAQREELTKDQKRILHPVAKALAEGATPTSLQDLAQRYQVALSTAFALLPPKKESMEAASPGEAFLAAFEGQTAPFGVMDATLQSKRTKAREGAIASLQARIQELEQAKPPAIMNTLGVSDGEPHALKLHVRGSHLNLVGAPIPRDAPLVLTAHLPKIAIPESGSGRRQLARWLTHPEHPLTSRVMVNRIWQHAFSAGLVNTPSNFGMRGDAPSHAELLDWLARDFVASRWSIKTVLRKILLSETWKISSTLSAEARALDPENRLLSAYPKRRFEAESLRDAVLFASGELSPAIGGTLLQVANADYVTNDQSGDKARYLEPRRTLYLPVIRNAMADIFQLFDYPDSSTHLEQRSSTIVPGQALWFLNSPLVVGASSKLASTIATDGQADSDFVTAAWRAVLARDPNDAERFAAVAYLNEPTEGEPLTSDSARTSAAAPRAETRAAMRRRSLIQSLLASNEFCHID